MTPHAAMIINHFKMRSDVDSYHLGGMGCSAGVIAIGLAQKLLRVRACGAWVGILMLCWGGRPLHCKRCATALEKGLLATLEKGPRLIKCWDAASGSLLRLKMAAMHCRGGSAGAVDPRLHPAILQFLEPSCPVVGFGSEAMPRSASVWKSGQCVLLALANRRIVGTGDMRWW